MDVNGVKFLSKKKLWKYIKGYCKKLNGKTSYVYIHKTDLHTVKFESLEYIIVLTEEGNSLKIQLQNLVYRFINLEKTGVFTRIKEINGKGRNKDSI